MMSVVEIVGEIVKACENRLVIELTDNNGVSIPVTSPHINYIFGDSQYVKDILDEYTRASFAEHCDKFPLVALFTPVEESRGGSPKSNDVTLNMIIACSSHTEWANETRLQTSFKKILHPIYERLMSEFCKHPMVIGEYDGIQHTYSENYSYGRYGAYTASNDRVSEPIDAIDIRDLKMKVLTNNCIRK